MKNNNWNWNFDKRIGELELGYSINHYKNFLEKLPKYDYEDYDTYQIKDSNSKIFVQENLILAIQAGELFNYNGSNLIGMSDTDALSLLSELEGAFQKINDREYYNLKLKMTLYSVNNLISWVTIDDWKKEQGIQPRE